MGDASRTGNTKLRKITLVILTIGITLLFLWMIWRFIMPLLLGAILAGLFHPLYNWMEQRFGGRKGLASTISLLIILLIFVLPLTGFLGLVAAQAYQLADSARPWVTKLDSNAEFNQLIQKLPFYDYINPYREQILNKLGSVASLIGAFTVSVLAAVAAGTASFLLSVFVMLYAMYFFFVDGRSLLRRILYYLPLPAEDEERLVGRFLSVARATIKGTLIIAAVQGILAGLAFWAAGIQGAAFWAAITAVLSVIPGLGPAVVWAPAVIYLFLIGRWGVALALLIWSAAVVSSVDNLLRPKLVGRDTKMPDLLILLSTLGGLMIFGAAGFILGPILAALFLTIWDLYGVAFKDSLPPESNEKLT